MSAELVGLTHAVEIVMWAWVLIRYARGWRLEWRPPVRRCSCDPDLCDPGCGICGELNPYDECPAKVRTA